VAEPALHFTLREWRQSVLAPRTLLMLLAAGLVLGMAGPFGTYHALSPVPRVLYWLAITVATYCTGLLSARLLRGHTPLKSLAVVPAYALAGLVGGIPVTLAVLAINGTVGFSSEVTGLGVAELFVYCSLISLCTAAALAWFQRSVMRETAGVADDPQTAALLNRLPVELRGPLQHLSMQDHYVEVVTDRGSHLVLMRLADAIAETDPVAGLRIHRSHWVALEAVVRTRRDGDRLFVETRSGARLPVSRSYRDEAKKAGLLPAS
jgi:hypothetical protein